MIGKHISHIYKPLNGVRDPTTKESREKICDTQGPRCNKEHRGRSLAATKTSPAHLPIQSDRAVPPSPPFTKAPFLGVCGTMVSILPPLKEMLVFSADGHTFKKSPSVHPYFSVCRRTAIFALSENDSHQSQLAIAVLGVWRSSREGGDEKGGRN